jgi:hypothetical protein
VELMMKYLLLVAVFFCIVTAVSSSEIGFGHFTHNVADRTYLVAVLAREVWFRYLKGSSDYIHMEYLEGKKELLLGAWPSGQEVKNGSPLIVSHPNLYKATYGLTYNASAGKLSRSAVNNRQIGVINWNNPRNRKSTGPQIYIDTSMECRVRQLPFRKWLQDDTSDDSSDVPTLHMRCIKKPISQSNSSVSTHTSQEEHNFYFERLRSYKKGLPPVVELLYDKDMERHPAGYTIIHKSDKIVLKANPEDDNGQCLG